MKQKKQIHLNYTEHLADLIREDDVFASAYLNQALEDGMCSFLVAIRKVALARGGFAKLSKKSSIARQSLYRMFSENGNPSLSNLSAVLDKVGLSFQIKPKLIIKKRT